MVPEPEKEIETALSGEYFWNKCGDQWRHYCVQYLHTLRNCLVLPVLCYRAGAMQCRMPMLTK